MKVAVVDIGTNSMRLLISEGATEVGRWVEITGLGRGVDVTGRLSEEAIDATLEVLGRYGRLMDDSGVERRMAIATSASRDAVNRESFFDRARQLLGVRPTLISGEVEARLAFAGATRELEVNSPVVVSDIGGGSTEFVSIDTEVTVDIGSVRLTERALPHRPASGEDLAVARSLVAELFATVDLGGVATLVGVAGTWTSLGAMALELPAYDRERVHGSRLSKARLEGLVEMLSGMTVDQTAAIPSLDPNRAPVILAGSLVAMAAMERLGMDEAVLSERDTLDGVAIRLLAIP